jgi:hypothetical protein
MHAAYFTQETQIMENNYLEYVRNNKPNTIFHAGVISWDLRKAAGCYLRACLKGTTTQRTQPDLAGWRPGPTSSLDLRHLVHDERTYRSRAVNWPCEDDLGPH